MCRAKFATVRAIIAIRLKCIIKQSIAEVPGYDGNGSLRIF